MAFKYVIPLTKLVKYYMYVMHNELLIKYFNSHHFPFSQQKLNCKQKITNVDMKISHFQPGWDFILASWEPTGLLGPISAHKRKT